MNQFFFWVLWVSAYSLHLQFETQSTTELTLFVHFQVVMTTIFVSEFSVTFSFCLIVSKLRCCQPIFFVRNKPLCTFYFLSSFFLCFLGSLLSLCFIMHIILIICHKTELFSFLFSSLIDLLCSSVSEVLIFFRYCLFSFFFALFCSAFWVSAISRVLLFRFTRRIVFFPPFCCLPHMPLASSYFPPPFCCPPHMSLASSFFFSFVVRHFIHFLFICLSPVLVAFFF